MPEEVNSATDKFVSSNVWLAVYVGLHSNQFSAIRPTYGYECKPTVRALDACRPTDLPGLRTDGYQFGMARRDETIISVRGEGSERMVDSVGPDSFEHGVASAPVWLTYSKGKRRAGLESFGLAWRS